MEDTKVKKELRPLSINVDEVLLEQIVEAGVKEILGFKLCRLNNEFDIDEGVQKVTIRVCGGQSGIPCQCEAVAASPEPRDEGLTVFPLNSTLYREDDF